MEIESAKVGVVNYALRRRKWVLLLAGIGVSTYGAYRVYHLPCVVQKRKKLLEVSGALASMVEFISDSAETSAIVSKDLKYFLRSESDQIPNSVKQISKIASSNEFSEAVIILAQSLTTGILRGFYSGERADDEDAGFLERVLDKLSSPIGLGFVSTVAGAFARNLVAAMYEDKRSNQAPSSRFASKTAAVNGDVLFEASSLPTWVNVMGSDKFQKLVADCVQLFVSTAVAVYLDKTKDINTYDAIFSGMTNPKHEDKVRDMLVCVCNGAIETFVKSCHQVMTNSDSNSNLVTPYVAINHAKGLMENGLIGKERIPAYWKPKNLTDGVKDRKWVCKASSSLSAPINRKLVLDVTGRITFETVRSFLQFLLEKIFGGIKRCAGTVRGVLVEAGEEVINFVSAKSSVLATICFSLCLHILDSAWLLAPA